MAFKPQGEEQDAMSEINVTPLVDCNGQVKQDTFLSSILIEFPFKIQWGLIA